MSAGRAARPAPEPPAPLPLGAPSMTSPGFLVFALAYVLISMRRLRWLPLDRPAVALAAAVALVVLGVLRPAEALAAVNGPTILLLFGMMGIGSYLAQTGFFEAAEGVMVRFARTPARLLGVIVWGSGLLSALITNDAVCILAAPLVVRLVRRHRLPALPFLLALATAANSGSAATLVGNPQNMLCAVLGGLSYREHLLLVGPAALLALGLNHALLWWLFRGRLRAAALAPPGEAPRFSRACVLTLLVIAATAVAYTLGFDLAWSTAAGFVALMVLHRTETAGIWGRIDWSVLLFFAGLFVVVEGLVRSGVPDALFRAMPLAAMGPGLGGLLKVAGVFLVGSNLVSNVPFILVVRGALKGLADPRLGWELLAMVSTFAGNLTLLGSVANIIVAEAGREVGGMGFWEYLRVGTPLALGATLLGTVWLWLVW